MHMMNDLHSATNGHTINMPVEKIRRISKYLRGRIDMLSNLGLTPLAIRKRLIHEEEVAILTRSIKLYIERRKRELDTGICQSERERPERRILTPEHLQFIDKTIEDNDETTAPELKKKLQDVFGVNVSISTVKRARRRLGWTKANTRYCQIVRDVNKEKRLAYCVQLLRTQEHFQDVIFTDESTIRMQSNVKLSFRRHGCRRRLKGVPKHPYQVHVWAGISRRGATGIAIFTGRMISEGYQGLLRQYLLPFIRDTYPETHRLYQDNDPKHVSKSTRAWFEKENVTVMPAPPESPDLNPIELMWASLKYHLRKNVRPRNKAELVNGIDEFWSSLTPETCNRYIDHLYKVVPAVVAADGAASGY